MTMIYKPSEVMKRFDLKESVYKKYILALEKEGYVFQKNQQGHRIFTDDDIQTLEVFIKLIKYDGMTIESVAKKIAETKGHDSITEPKEDSHTVMNLIETVVNNALEKREQQHSAEIKALSNELESLKVELLRDSMEQKKVLNEVKDMLIAQQETAASQKKKGFFARLFGR